MSVEVLNQALVGFKLDAKCVDFQRHRHFAFYDLELGPKCQVARINRLANEIALKIKSKTIPIIKPMHEKGLVRLQVLTGPAETLHLDKMLNKHPNPGGFLPFLFGETDEGVPLWVDMADNPHMLVAGATGSGKSVFLHNLISNAQRTPNLELFLSDPKSVEFSPYRDSNYESLISCITTNYSETIEMLESLVSEMENRYQTLMRLGFQSIQQMRFPFSRIMVIIDEVADLILADGRSHLFEELVVKLAQKSRAAGIYLILATQRPSVDVLTGLIKANFEARLACRVSSRVDSQVILDQPGAEHLLGKGDAIFKNRNYQSVRLQIALP